MKNEKDRAKESLKSLLDPTQVYSIGRHICGLHHQIKSSKEDLADSILDNGLISGFNEGGGLVENVYVQGSHNLESKLNGTVEHFIDGVNNDVMQGGVIVAIPATLKDKDGNEYYLGVYPDDLDFIAKDDERAQCLPINKFVSKLGKLPPEFILGVIQQYEGKAICVPNDRYISRLSQEEQFDLLQQYQKEGLECISLNEAITNNNPALAETLGITNYLGESAVQYKKDREVLQEQKHIISTRSIGKRTIGAPVEDKEYIGRTFEELSALLDMMPDEPTK